MATHFDPRLWPTASGIPADSGAGQPFDWHGLTARIAAADQTRMALAHARNFASGRAEGSFDPDCARLVGSYAARPAAGESLREYDYPPLASDVNRVDSGPGKTRSAITGDTAGIDTTGDRGLK